MIRLPPVPSGTAFSQPGLLGPEGITLTNIPPFGVCARFGQWLVIAWAVGAPLGILKRVLNVSYVNAAY